VGVLREAGHFREAQPHRYRHSRPEPVPRQWP
jgi:hypothetical protein